MANIASLLAAQLATPGRALYRQFEGRPFLTLLAVAKDGDEKQVVRRANERLAHFPRYVRVRRAILSPEPWTVENGLLTPTLKVKRNDVLKRFAPEIEAVYASGAAAD
jgi:long-chain acyl-CoA synthetase